MGKLITRFQAKWTPSKTLYVQEAQKGLKSFLISLDIKLLIKSKLNLVFKKLSTKNVNGITFNRNQIRKIKSEFKKLDHNNFYLSNLLYLEHKKALNFDKKVFQKIVTITKLLGLYKSKEFPAIKAIINLILKELKYSLPPNEIQTFTKPNEKIIGAQLKGKARAQKNNLDYVANVFLLILSTSKTKTFQYDEKFVINLAELNYLEDQKSQYFIHNRNGTIFGDTLWKKIANYKTNKSNLDRKYGGHLIKTKDDQTMKNLMGKQDAILAVANSKITIITNFLSANNLEQNEYRFVFEQTGRPYLKDYMPLSNGDRLYLLINYLLLLVWSFIVALPIYYVVYNAFNEYSTTILSLKGFKFSVANFKYLFSETMFTTWFFNTIKIASVVTIINLLSSSLLAYALSRFRFKGRKPAFKTLIILNMLPSIAGLTSYIVLNQLLQNLFHAGPYLVMYLVYAGTNLLAFSFVIKNYLDTISREIDEAAKMDGASSMRTFLKIIVPLIAPILGIVALQSFMIPFIDILMPRFFLSQAEDYTLPLGLTFIKNNPDLSIQNQGAYTAGGMLVAIPMTLVYFVADYFMKQNKAQGAIKG